MKKKKLFIKCSIFLAKLNGLLTDGATHILAEYIFVKSFASQFEGYESALFIKGGVLIRRERKKKKQQRYAFYERTSSH